VNLGPTRARLLCLLCLLCFISFLYLFISPNAGAQSQPPTAYAITHAKIFTLAGNTIEDGTLIIRDGKIAAVGAGLDIPRAPGD